MEKKIINPIADIFLIKFPIWVPIVFYLITTNFESLYIPILILYLLIGEIHFGSTFVFFLDKNYRELFKKESYVFLFWPILIIGFCIFFAFYFSISAVLFLILLFNFYHVNRQSVGILKIYKKDENINPSVILLYIVSGLLCLAGVFKFILKSNLYFENSHLILKFFICLFLFFLLIVIISSKNNKLNNIFNFSTGSLIFFPVLFCDQN